MDESAHAHAPDPVAHTLKTRIGGYVRRGNIAAADETRRELKVHQLAKHIREVVDAAPPLTAEDAAMLRGLLPPVGAGGGANAAA